MRNRGFTLIELLVVIAIIGILSSVVLASLNTARERSRDARRISDVKQLQLALELYYDSSSTYPLALSSLAGDYIAAIPTDPQDDSAYLYQAMEADESACASTPCPDYVLGATLEDDAHSVLEDAGDVDGTVAGQDCDAAYCVQP